MPNVDMVLRLSTDQHDPSILLYETSSEDWRATLQKRVLVRCLPTAVNCVAPLMLEHPIAISITEHKSTATLGTPIIRGGLPLHFTPMGVR